MVHKECHFIESFAFLMRWGHSWDRAAHKWWYEKSFKSHFFEFFFHIVLVFQRIYILGHVQVFPAIKGLRFANHCNWVPFSPISFLPLLHKLLERERESECGCRLSPESEKKKEGTEHYIERSSILRPRENERSQTCQREQWDHCYCRRSLCRRRREKSNLAVEVEQSGGESHLQKEMVLSLCMLRRVTGF